MSEILAVDAIPAIQNWLLTQGFNPENLQQRGTNGDTALMQATRAGEFEIARLHCSNQFRAKTPKPLRSMRSCTG